VELRQLKPAAVKSPSAAFKSYDAVSGSTTDA